MTEIKVSGEVFLTLRPSVELAAMLTGSTPQPKVLTPAEPERPAKPESSNPEPAEQPAAPAPAKPRATRMTGKGKSAEPVEGSAPKAEPAEQPAAPKVLNTPALLADFRDLNEEDQLEAIRAEVTKGTKAGKSADIKFILAQFDAGRAGELAPELYADAYEAFLRYGDGHKLDEIFPSNLN